jgi:arylsulfatase
VAFYDEQRDWWTPPTKLGIREAFDLITDSKEEYPATAVRNSGNAVPVMKIMTEFEQSSRKHPPVTPGMPEPCTLPEK